MLCSSMLAGVIGIIECKLVSFFFYLTAAHCIAGKHGLLATGFYFLLTVQAVFYFFFTLAKRNKINSKAA